MLLVGLGVSGTVTSQFDVYLPQGTFARYLDRREGFKILLSNDLYVLNYYLLYVCFFTSNYSPPGFMTSKFDEKGNNIIV